MKMHGPGNIKFKKVILIVGTLNVRAEKHKFLSSVYILDTISLVSKLKMSVLPARNLHVQVTKVSPPAANEVKTLPDHTYGV
jgi:hypothetical protein